MNVVRIMNGIGNQMFQYAFYKKLKLMGKDVRADISWFESSKADRVFSLKDAFPGIELDTEGAAEEVQRMMTVIRGRPVWLKAFQYIFRDGRIRVQDGHGKVYKPKYLQMENRYFDGYWQTERYWLKEKNEILRSFTFREIKNERLQQIEDICRGKDTVSVHIRRGDYLASENLGLYSGICTEEYYRKALAHMQKTVPNARFVFFSDDVQWVRENWKLKNQVMAADYLDAGMPDWIEMKLMSLCANNITANSTFSWWGAYLNRNPQKTVISPQIWQNGVNAPDICPPEWIRI